MDKDDEFLNDQSMTAPRVAPDMKSLPIAIEQVAPGRYVGEFASEKAGSYLIVVNPGDGKAPIRTGVNVGYSAEFRDHETNLALLELAGQDPRRSDGPRGQLRRPTAWPRSPQADGNRRRIPFRRDLPQAVTNQAIWPWLVRGWRAACSGAMCSSAACRSTSTGSGPRSAALRDNVLGREREAGVPETMSRLRSRKARDRRANRKPPRRGPLRAPTRRPPPARRRSKADRSDRCAEAATPSPTMKPDAPEPESYTARLLKAKKQVWRDRDEDQETS